MLALGVRPGLGVLSPGSRRGALALMRDGLAGEAPCAAVSLGPFETVGQGAERLIQYTQDLPTQCHWWIMKGGAHQLALRATAMALGGHVRVGFEDSVRTYEGSLATSNAVFVDRMVQLAAATARPVATPSQARAILLMNAIG
jgi:3-keto-5-aminohexanoate cleavage enzyme